MLFYLPERGTLFSLYCVNHNNTASSSTSSYPSIVILAARLHSISVSFRL